MVVPKGLESASVKFERAKVHRKALDDDLGRVFNGRTYRIVPDIYDDGRRHVFRAKNPPTPNPEWSAILGDCVHNLRSALDHVAYQLAAQPNLRTQFPIRNRPPTKRRWFRKRRILPDISGGVSDDVRRALEAVQPYNRRDLNHGLDLLSLLDNIDKHRDLIVVASASEAHITSHIGGSADEPPPQKTIFTRRPLEDGNVIAVVTYDAPYPQPDPNLQFFPAIAFGKSGPVAKELVNIVLDDLIVRVRDDVQQFMKFLP
jgi:hypothetical protein